MRPLDMRKLALVVVLVLVASHRPARADCRGAPCPPWVTVIGYTFAAGITTGYAYGTGRFIYSDLNDADQTREYGAVELSANGLLATAFALGTIDSVNNRSVGGTLVLGGLTTLHTTLAVHGAWRIYRESGDLERPDGNISPTAVAWIGGSLYGLNTMYWVSGLHERHSRAYGITEAAVNAPIAIGLGYLAYDRFSTFRGGPGLLYGGMALASTALVVHGIRTAVAPRSSKSFDLVPMFDDHTQGLSLSGTW